MNLLNEIVDTLGTIMLVFVVAIVFGPYMIMDKLFFKTDRYIKQDKYGWY